MNIWALAAGIWAVFATAVALAPRGYHKFYALYVLIPTAIVILIGLGSVYGATIAFIALVAVISVLRWPFYFIGKFIWCKLTGKEFVGPNLGQKKK